MTSEQERMMRVETRQEDLARRITELEQNQKEVRRWGFGAIGTLLLKAIFDIAKGTGV